MYLASVPLCQPGRQYHYHLILLLNGSRTQSIRGHLALVETLCWRVPGAGLDLDGLIVEALVTHGCVLGDRPTQNSGVL